VGCVGSNAHKQLGLGDGVGSGSLFGDGAVISRGSQPSEVGDGLWLVPLPAGAKAVGMDTGFAHTCVVLDDGGVACWGSNDRFALGCAPGAEPANGVCLVDLGAPAVSVFCGGSRSCAVLASGAVKCWGSNFFGEVSGAAGVHSQGVACYRGLALRGPSRCSTPSPPSSQLGLGDARSRGDSSSEMGLNLPVVPIFSVCSSCAPGQYKADSTAGACLECTREAYKPVALSSACRACGPGTYSERQGASVCSRCPAGTASAGIGRTTNATCGQCAFDTCPGSRECMQCDAGYFMDCDPIGWGHVCVRCASMHRGDNTSGAVGMRDGCGGCSAGTYEEASGVCVLCPAGLKTSLPGSRTCDLCVTGYYLHEHECVQCPADGTVCDRPGVTLATLPLAMGFWRSLPTSLRIRPCLRDGNCQGGGAVGQGLCKLGSKG
jgi:hypothetical protein